MAVNAFVFDSQYYAQQNPDVAAAVSRGEFTSFQEHFNLFGRFEQRDPNALFDTSYYLGQYPDVAEAGVNPFVHFQQFGSTEGRFFNEAAGNAIDTDGNGRANEFDEAEYRAQNSDVDAAITNGSFQSAYQHYVLFGQFEGRPGAQLNDDTALNGPIRSDGGTGGGVAGQTFTLTAGVDNFAGTGANDTFIAGEVVSGTTPTATLTTGDTINGGSGNDTLNITQTAAFTGLPTGASVSNVETVNVTSGGAISLNTTNGFSGLTQLTTNNSGTAGGSASAQSVTAAATTNVTANVTSLQDDTVTVNGGKNVTVNASGGNTTDADVTVGGTTAAAGTVAVNYTGATLADGAATTAQTNGDITVTGGTSVNVTSTGAVSGGSNDAADALNLGDVTVNGNASTTNVTVTQTAAQDRVAGAAGTGKAAITSGDVTVTDANSASATAAGTIETVTLGSFGVATVNSGALTTLNLSGKGTSVDAGTLGALTTAANTSLALNANGLTTTGTVSIDSDITTLNLAGNTAASTINALTASGVTTLNVSGDAKVNLSAQTLTNNATIAVTNTAGVSLGTQLGNNVLFTGGAGDDSISLGQTTKAINMGGGNDVVTLSNTTLGAGGSVNGGAGNDTIVANTNGSSFAANPAVSGFETLRVAGAQAEGSHNAAGFTALEVGVLNGAATFTNVAANVGLTVVAAPTAATTVELANATGTSDVFNLALKSDATINAGTITLAGVETVNISSTDTETGANPTANVNVLDLNATSAQSIVVTGNTGLNIDSAGNNVVTNFDASGVTGSDSVVTYVSANDQVGAVVTIKGGAGADSLTGSATANDTISGGAGADTLVYTGGADSFNGGMGNDTFDVTGTGTRSAFLTIGDAAKSDIIDFAGLLGTAGDVDYAAGAGGFGAQKVTLGAAATLDQYLDAAAAGTNAGTGTEVVSWFNFSGDTYLVVDNSDAGTFQSTADQTTGDSVVKLTGVLDLSASAVVDGVLTIA